jgi:predicted ArsR family transcriptional regulator
VRDRRLAALASLGNPLRRALYHCVTSRDGGVGRDEAAATVGVSRALAAYHLDKLVEAGLLAGAVEADPSGGARSELVRAARALGAEVAAEAGDGAGLGPLLADRGYEPYEDQGVLRLRNCPFGRLAQAHRDLVCQANLAFMSGLLERLPGSGPRPVLEPRPGRCCVAFV